ncbi:PD40 domain-containing protein [Candidatus Poribacteria bacterium]|nr:PD40 domain-containing protein [Candidatus Poribacteria bacterium]
MKSPLLKQTAFALVMSLVLASVSPAELADTKIAFVSNRDGNYEIYVMNANGSNPINLTRHPAKDMTPSWSPDGTKIAFASDRGGNFEIYMMNADGSNLVNLTNHPKLDAGPSWSPAPLAVSQGGKLATLWGEVKRRR